MIHGPHLKDMTREEAQVAGKCAACWNALQRGEPFNHLYHRAEDQRWS